MITRLHLENFKSWQDTGEVRLGKLTGLFGTNSSGKTSLLQFLLMLKQTVESPDRSRVFHTGSDLTDVDLGTFYDIIYAHQEPGTIHYSLTWSLPKPLEITDALQSRRTLARSRELTFEAKIEGTGNVVEVQRFAYQMDGLTFGMERVDAEAQKRNAEYRLIHTGYDAKRTLGRKWPLPEPVKSYGFPDQAVGYYQNVGFLPDLVLAFEELFGRLYYLGPLREYPSRLYQWAGERPSGVGTRGERAVSALLASGEQGKVIQPGIRMRRRTIEEHVAWWLRELGMIHAFNLQQVAPNRKEYEVRVRRAAHAPEVLITDVGFGVSQILPVLVLCFYAPPGSTLVLEQPEIHLHPSVQAGLADVFINAIEKRGVQIILESHSEHLLRRLQRRVAEEKIAADDINLYFVDIERSRSTLRELDLDPFGNIRNWPRNFFGDEMGDLAAMTEKAMQRMAAGDGV